MVVTLCAYLIVILTQRQLGESITTFAVVAAIAALVTIVLTYVSGVRR